MSSSQSLVILGGGPIGLEMALAAHTAGSWGRITLVERSSGPGGNVAAWGHVRLFSPWALNTTALGLEALDATGCPQPDPSAYPTGRELVDAYLAPIWRHLEGLGVTCLWDTEAVAVSRGAVLKGTMKGRSGAPFTVLVAKKTSSEGGAKGGETAVESLQRADALVDATGTYGQRVWLGPGGMPALGERSLEASSVGGVDCGVPDIAGKDRGRFGGGKVSELNTVLGLAFLKHTRPAGWVLTFHGGSSSSCATLMVMPSPNRTGHLRGGQRL